MAWNLVQRSTQIKNSKKFPKESVLCPKYADISIFFTVMTPFPKKKMFFKISTLIWRESCLWRYIKRNLILFKFYKVIVLIPSVYIHTKKDNLEITFAFSVTPCNVAVHTQIWYFKIFLAYVHIKYKIELVKVQVSKVIELNWYLSDNIKMPNVNYC